MCCTINRTTLAGASLSRGLENQKVPSTALWRTTFLVPRDSSQDIRVMVFNELVPLWLVSASPPIQEAHNLRASGQRSLSSIFLFLVSLYLQSSQHCYYYPPNYTKHSQGPASLPTSTSVLIYAIYNRLRIRTRMARLQGETDDAIRREYGSCTLPPFPLTASASSISVFLFSSLLISTGNRINTKHHDSWAGYSSQCHTAAFALDVSRYCYVTVQIRMTDRLREDASPKRR